MNQRLRWLIIRYLKLTALSLVLGILAIVVYLYFSGFFEKPADTTFDGITNYSPEVRDVNKEVRQTFWEESDYVGTYQILKTKAREITEANRKKRQLTETELNDEMSIMSSYAAITRNLYPEEGLKLYAEIYNNRRYTGAVRADALFHAMFYLAEKYGSELTLENANDWIFAPDLFGTALVGSKMEGKTLSNDEDVLKAAIAGLDHAATITESLRVRTRILAQRYDLEVRLLTDKFIDDYQKQGGDPALLIEHSLASLDEESRLRLDELYTREYRQLESSIFRGLTDKEEWPDFRLEFVHAAKNVLRTYTTLQSLGIDVTERFDRLLQTSNDYLKYHSTENPDANPYQIQLQSSVTSLYDACHYVLENNYDLSSPEELKVLSDKLAPFLAMPAQEKARLSVVAIVGQRGYGYCYSPYVYAGKNLESFRQALINEVGGWQNSQFE